MAGANRTLRIRVFIDYWNFANLWVRHVNDIEPDRNLDWKALPRAILDQLDNIPSLRSSRKELRAVKIYASVRPPNSTSSSAIDRIAEDKYERLRDWFQDELDQITAYTVDLSDHVDNPIRCPLCDAQNRNLVEQGVDTKMAIDLVALASRDLYDIAILATHDDDLVPSTQCVQDSIDKQVIHLGFKNEAAEVRNEAWGHIFVEDLLADILLP
jgi:uncharacterized LabA/DUF88 family protein